MAESMNGNRPLQVRLDADMRRRFKTVCADQGKTMTEVLREFIEFYVRKREEAK